MSTIKMILFAMLLQSICDFFAMSSGYAEETAESAKIRYFHVYNRFLILVSVVYYIVLAKQNANALYLATVLCYIYGLVCLPIHQFWFLKYFDLKHESGTNQL